MSDLSGRLAISAQRAASGARVSIRSTRPVTAARIFAGKPVREAAARLPLLFSVCATAQAQASVSACEQALGISPAAEALRRRALLLRAETAKEHAWRLLLDWPKALGSTPATAPMASVMRAYSNLRAAEQEAGDPFLLGAAGRTTQAALSASTPATLLAAVIADAVLGMPAQRWLDEIMDAHSLAAWADRSSTTAADVTARVLQSGLAGLGRNAVHALPQAPEPRLIAGLAEALAGTDADAFAAAPIWQARPCETTPFSRASRTSLVAVLAAEHGNGLLPRLAALLSELARCAAGLSSPQAPPSDAAEAPSGASSPADVDFGAGTGAGAGVGLGWAAAARGLLVHRIEVADGLVRSYRILAPTEWNFHPRGVVAAGLSALAATETTDLPNASAGLAGSGLIGTAADGIAGRGSGAMRADDADADLRRRAALWITAVDPCVDYDLSVS